MTNTAKLKGKMAEKSQTIESISKKIGLSATGFFNKMHNIREFRISEVQKISDVLELSGADITEIFFANKVELNSTV